VDAERHPDLRSTADLGGLTIGVQQGNTSQPVADRLVAEGKAARVKVYALGEIEQALADLTTGGCDALMKLAPVTAWLVRDVLASWIPCSNLSRVSEGRSFSQNFTAACRSRNLLCERMTMPFAGFVRVTAGRQRVAQHAHPQATFKPRGRATPPMRPSASACRRSE